jgi:signal transduction histidine kinase
MSESETQANAQAIRDEASYEELSRLNNELVAAQRELAKKNAELAKFREQKNFFFGMAAHDLRNPLQAILLYSQFLMDETASSLTEEQRRFAAAIKSSSRLMLNLINDMLEISKIEAGNLALEMRSADLNSIVEQNVALNRALAESKQVKLELSANEQMPKLRLDALKIEQVLNNLIGNAISFSPADAIIEVRLERSDGDAMISVSDAGPGVSPEEMNMLFEPFERNSLKRSAREKGAGLGLAIVKKIVTGHGGKISVESEPGQGATFRVSLPIPD